MIRNLIAEASSELAAAQSTDGTVSAYYLANARLALEAAKSACAEVEIMVRAREAEAVRLSKAGAP